MHEGRPAFLVAAADETGTGSPIVLTQRDIRELQLATGAIRAGIVILLAEAARTPADLESVLVAGGFGNFIRRNNAQRIGLLPHGVAHQRIRHQGNTSLAGAQLVAMSKKARQLADDVARRTPSRRPGTQSEFRHPPSADAMLFPRRRGRVGRKALGDYLRTDRRIISVVITLRVMFSLSRSERTTRETRKLFFGRSLDETRQPPLFRPSFCRVPASCWGLAVMVGREGWDRKTIKLVVICYANALRYRSKITALHTAGSR